MKLKSETINILLKICFKLIKIIIINKEKYLEKQMKILNYFNTR